MSASVKLSIKYVEANRSRHGKMRYFFRKCGKRHGRINGEPGSNEFLEQYNAYLAGERPNETLKPASKHIQPETFGYLCRAYTGSMQFSKLDPATQQKRRRIIEQMMMEPVTLQPNESRIFGQFPVAHIDRSDLEVLRDRKAATPFAADERVKVLNQIFNHAVKNDMIPHNPAKEIERFRKRTDGHKPATWADIEKFREYHGEKSTAWLAMMILIFTGIRVSDLRQIGRQHRQGQTLKFRMVKGRNRRPVDMDIYIHPALSAVLDQVPQDRFHYVVTEQDRPFASDKAMSARVSSWFKQAGVENITAHSVRKLLSIEMAEAGATDEEMNGALGWTGASTSKIYTKNAAKAVLSRNAILKVFDSKTATPRKKVWQKS